MENREVDGDAADDDYNEAGEAKAEDGAGSTEGESKTADAEGVEEDDDE